MNELAPLDAYGVLTEPTTLKIQRLLPGSIERVWAYLTDSDLRRQWLAAGEMEMKAGAPFEFLWRNDEFTNTPGQRPPIQKIMIQTRNYNKVYKAVCVVRSYSFLQRKG